MNKKQAEAADAIATDTADAATELADAVANWQETTARDERQEFAEGIYDVLMEIVRIGALAETLANEIEAS